MTSVNEELCTYLNTFSNFSRIHMRLYGKVYVSFTVEDYISILLTPADFQSLSFTFI